MSTHVFDVTAFRLQFPEFADPLVYPDVRLQGYWDLATVYKNTTNSCTLTGAQLQQALNLMTAHLARLYASIDKNKTTGLLQSASVDKVSVVLTPPPIKTGFQWWLSQTPYGQQLWALLQVTAAAGFWFGGLPELSAFRKTAGIF